jgi:glyoxylase-like metal-dependent hydrolase (beta-lactamase superfamily II)
MFFSNEPKIKKGKEVFENLFYFPEVGMLDCNQYVIKDPITSELSLFDAGNGISLSGLIEGFKNLNLEFENITNVYITHEHVDHVIGLYKLMEKLKDSPPTIHAFGETAVILREGHTNKIFPGNLGISPQMFGVNVLKLEVKELKDSCKVGNNFNFQILHTPGHSPSSICYYDSNKKVLIPGDLVFINESFGRYDFPGGSLSKLIKSIGQVAKLDVKYLLPGHMGISQEGSRDIALSYRMVQSIGRYY